MFRAKFVEIIEKRILSSTMFLFSDNRAIYNNVEKYGTAVQATDEDIMLRIKSAICMPDN